MAIAFHKALEDTLHRALHAASIRKHEYATLEHLLIGLIDDEHANKILSACGVNISELKEAVVRYLDTELESLKVDAETDPSPTSGFQRVVQRSILHVQSSGRDQVTGANVLVALFSERESYAVHFLQQQDISRLDAVTYISTGLGKLDVRQPEARVRRQQSETDPGWLEEPAPRDSAIALQSLSEPTAETGAKADAPIERLRQLQHDLTPSSDAVSTAPALATPKIAEKVVEFLAELLIQEANRNPRLSTSPLLTVGIYGPWGSGKSTLLAAISRLLTSDGAVVVPINTWRWDGQQDIYAFMNEQLLTGLSQNSSYRWSARRLRLLLWVRRNFRKIVLFLTVAGGLALIALLVDVGEIRDDPNLAALKSFWAAVGAGVLAIMAKPIAAVLERALIRARLPTEPGEVLSSSYKYLMIAKSMGRSKEKPIFFMFDDLDRCPPDRVVEFMRSIHRLTASGSVSIIGCDDRIVAAAIYSEFQKIADVSGEGREFGDRFLEKMVQVHFRMPDVNEADLRSLGLLRSAKAGSGHSAKTAEMPIKPFARADVSVVGTSPTKDLGQDNAAIDIASLHSICLEVLGAIVELYRLPIRRIKFLTNLTKLYCMVFPPPTEEAAYKFAAFLGMSHIDPHWLVDHYFGQKEAKTPAEKKPYQDRILSYLGADREAVLALYGLCGLDDAQCLSAASGVRLTGQSARRVTTKVSERRPSSGPRKRKAPRPSQTPASN